MKRKFYNDSQSTIGYTFHSQWCFAFSSPHSFQFIILSHFVVQLLLHSVKEVSTAIVLASSDVGIETIAVLGFDAMKLLYLLDDRYQKGMEEGMEKSRAEGMEEGMSQRSLEIARKMCWQRVWQELQGVHPDASLLHPLLPR